VNKNIIMGLSIGLLIVVSACCSCMETAFSVVNTIRLRHKSDNGNKKAKKALYICEHFDHALIAILIVNNVANLGSSSLATILCINIFGNMGAAVSTGVLTFLVLTFGEIIPKCIGKENSELISLYMSDALRGLMVLLKPLIFFFIKIKTLISNVISVNDNNPSVTEAELKYIIESIEEQGVLEEQESEMVQSALEFDEKAVAEILTPRVDLTAIDLEGDSEHNTYVVMTERYSRIPVYRGSIDNIVGILHSRDYLEALVINNRQPDIEKLLQPAYFIYKNKKLSAILNEFKKQKFHIAVVTDEYGGTLGIVTMEDLLEEIVGEIWDEDEEIERPYQKISERKYRISGDMELKDMLDLFEIDVKKSNSDSVTAGGFIADNFGRIPSSGESFVFEELTIKVETVFEQRVITAIVELKDL